MDDSQGQLKIINVRQSDAGTYVCTGSNFISEDTDIAVLNVIGEVTHCYVPALIIIGEMHFLLISEKEFFHEIKCNGLASFMDFINCPKSKSPLARG